ncbi:hypothetical protein KY285_010771 [Solanum tuberosum]|nr:hypothetical protein KY289_011347 [Solanum tuberosum]KAH0735064.1 hypothetical protein KY285_010771 [Solanum tuberosum]
MRNTTIHLVPTNIARILVIPLEGWGHYVKLEWPQLPSQAFALSISQKLSFKPNLTHHRRVEKNNISHWHQLYFDVVHKIIILMKQRRVEANFLDLTLMELLEIELLID